MPLIHLDDSQTKDGVFLIGRDVSIAICSDHCLLHGISPSARIVRTGQTVSTRLTVLLDADNLLVPLDAASRDDLHVLGRQQNRTVARDRWSRILDLRHPALMNVEKLCDCMAQVHIYDGLTLEDADTTPPWKILRERLRGAFRVGDRRVHFAQWQAWMRDLAAGLAALEARGLAHGDPFPFNAITMGEHALWIDYSHLSDDPQQMVKDAWAFLLFTLLYTSKLADCWSASLLAALASALAISGGTDVFNRIEQVLRESYLDWSPLCDGREPFQHWAEVIDRNQLLTNSNYIGLIGRKILAKASAQYFSDFLYHLKCHADVQKMYWIEKARHRLVEQETLRLTVPRAILVERNDEIAVLKAGLAERDAQLVSLNQTMAEREQESRVLQAGLAERDAQLVSLNQTLVTLGTDYHQLISSRSWRFTRPLRLLMRFFLYPSKIVDSDLKLIRRKLQGVFQWLPLPIRYKAILRRLFFRITGWPAIPKAIPPAVSMQQSIAAPDKASGAYLDVAGEGSKRSALVPFFGVRAPYGKRRAAILTNQLLDWHDVRPRFGGGERYALELAKLLHELNIKVTFFQPSFKGISEGEYHGFRVRTFPLGDSLGEFHYSACSYFTENTVDYDHVYYHLPEYASGSFREDGLMTCHGIWFDHNNYPNALFRTPSWFNHLYSSFANPLGIISVDTNSIGFIRSLWPELARRMYYIPNFYDGQQYQPSAANKDSSRIMVLFPRRSQINRGSRIFSQIVDNIPHDVSIVWLGEGDPEETAIIKKVCLVDSRVSFSVASFDEMPDWYRRAAIVVIPTIACEGTSLACIEALASGCAVIATIVGGLPDLIHHGFNGLLVDPNARAISDAINYLIENKAERKRLQKNAPESVKFLELNHWRHRWARVFLDHGWINDHAYDHWQSKQALKEQGNVVVHPAQEKWVILTRNAIHGGVESIIREQSKLLKAPVIVCGGHDMRSTCPFDYTRADDPKCLRKAIQQYNAILYHWLPDWAVDVIDKSGAFAIEFVHRMDTSDSDKNVPAGLVTHSTFLAQYIYEHYGRFCHVVEHPIDTSLFVPAEQKGKYVGAITSYYDTKGIDLFLEAWAILRSEFPDTSLRFYGSGDDEYKFKRLSSKLDLTVEFCPPTNTPWVALRDFKCFVVPSRVEGFPVAILEALAMNVPVVASDLDGIREFNLNAIKRGYKPYIQITHVEDIDELVSVLRTTLTCTDTQTSREYICEYFTPKKHGDDLFNAVLEFRQRAGK